MRRLLLAVLLTCVSAHAKTFTIDDYIARLERIHTSIATNQLAAAEAEAAEMSGSEILSPRGNFHADDSLLAFVAEARKADRDVLRRLELTIAELRNTTNAADARPDPKLLQQVAAEQEVPELARGGELTAPPIPKVPLMERIFQSIGDSLRWIAKKIRQFLRWFADLFPDTRQKSGATSGMRWIVIAIVTLIVIAILILAFEVIRRARRPDPNTLTSSAPLRSSRDDDPLSRGATEWERYAAQLAADGRFREAIRAWYHAVLVTCYGAGVLHFRKGRTNWEYIASLPPSTPWRAAFIRLTQRFEQEWYGSLQSNEDALEECSSHAQQILEAVDERGAA